MAKRKIIEVKRGSVIVKVRYAPTRAKGNVYEAWLVEYYDLHGERVRLRRASLEEAKAEAEKAATRIANGEALVSTLTPEDCASYARARELLEPLGKSLEVAVAEYVEAAKRLAAPLLVPRSVPDAVQEFLDAKKQDGVGGRHWQDLESRLGAFSTDFNIPVASLSGSVLDEWLRRKQRVGEWTGRTRNHYRRALLNFVNFAKAVSPSSVSKMLAKLAAKAGLTWKQNALRHSFISYRLALVRSIDQVSEERGTSVPTLKKKVSPASFASRGPSMVRRSSSKSGTNSA